jgi:hypothetical protein
VKKTALALTACAALALTACGSDTTSSAPTPKASTSPALTKAEFTQQANAICADLNKKVEAASQKVAAEHDPSADMDAFLKAAVDTVTPISDQGVADLRKLHAPEDLQAGFDDWLAAVEGDTAKIKKDPKVLMADNAFADADQKAKALGLEVCAS